MAEVGPSKPFLVERLETAYQFIRAEVERLSDEEYFWEPVPGCWSVRRNLGENPPIIFTTTPNTRPWYVEDGWTGDGWLEERPRTIAALLTHVAACKHMYHDFAFGDGSRSFADLVPSTATPAITLLETGHRLLVDALHALDESELTEMRPTNWGEEKPAWWIFWTMVEHDLIHGAEIGRTRALYRCAPEPTQKLSR